jgi:hypothetical protein
MNRQIILAAIAATLLGTAAVMAAQAPAPLTPDRMSFFVTGEKHSGNLGGLAGADAICQRLAQAAGSPATRVWRAYLSTQGTPQTPSVNARDRIGNGPWFNSRGVMIAGSLADLHGDVQRDSNLIFVETALTEKGELVPARVGRAEGVNNEHDMLTGSDSHGRAFPPGTASAGGDRTCKNWTSDSAEDHAMIGHHDRQSQWNTSWNSSHTTAGCSAEALVTTGGAGRFYCFATN